MRIRTLVLPLMVLGAIHGSAFAAASKQSTAEQEFCRLDKDSDRKITFDEFAACEFYKLEHVRALPFADPEAVARGKNAPLTDDELKSYLFRKADRNQDKRIDRQEWEEFYNSLIDPGGGVSHGYRDRK